MVSLDDVMRATRQVTRDVRGFDDAATGWLAPGTWERATSNPAEGVAAICAAVADVAGWYAACELDRDDERDRVTLRSVAADFESAARALRDIVDDRDSSAR